MKNMKIRQAAFLIILAGVPQFGFPSSFMDKLQKSLDAAAKQASATSTAATTETAPQAKPTPNQGYWTDPKTGLTWSRCLLSTTWEDGSCSNNYPEKYSWADVVLKVNDLTMLGFDDWRLPTVQELNTVFYGRMKPDGTPCSNSSPKFDLADKNAAIYVGCGSNDGPDGVFLNASYETLWTSTPGKDTARTAISLETSTSAASGGVREEDRLSSPNSLPQNPNPLTLRALVVRGGTRNGVFENSVNLAKADLQYFDKGRSQYADQVRLQRAAVAQEAQERVQRVNAANEKVRKNLKVGDRVKEGLVLEIKGELVKIQRYGKECKNYSAAIMPNTGERVCLAWKQVVTGEEWMRRDEISAP